MYYIVVSCLYYYPPSFYHSLGRFLTTLGLRAQIGDPRTVVSECALESPRRFLIGPIHRYPCNLFLLSYLSLFFSYLLWSLTSFCRYSCTYFMLELRYWWRLSFVLRLSVRTWGFSALRMYVAITSPYLRDWSVTTDFRYSRLVRSTSRLGWSLKQFSGI